MRGSSLSNGEVVAPAPKPGAAEDTPKDPNEGSTGGEHSEGDGGY